MKFYLTAAALISSIRATDAPKCNLELGKTCRDYEDTCCAEYVSHSFKLADEWVTASKED